MSPRNDAVIRKTSIVVTLLLLAGGGALYFWKSRHTGSDLVFLTQPLKRGRIEAKVTATGTVSPLVNVLVGSQISGRVVALYADYNTPVR